jgi:hypothetical protein
MYKYYSYETEADGLCEFRTKKAAINNAQKALSSSGWVNILSPTGKVVATVGCHKKSGGYYA